MKNANEMSPQFQAALKYVFRNEGGFVNDPLDPGGATNLGITQATLSQYRKTSVSIKDVQEISEWEAMCLYFALYWKPLNCDMLVQTPIAIALFDCGVLYGIQTAGVLGQRALRDCGFPVAVDGNIGPVTIQGLNSVNINQFISTLILHLENRIELIVARRPSSIKFRDGWVNRASRLRSLLTGV